MHLNLKQLNDPCQFTPDIKPFGRLSLNTTVDVCPSQEDPLGDMGSVKGHIRRCETTRQLIVARLIFPRLITSHPLVMSGRFSERAHQRMKATGVLV